MMAPASPRRRRVSAGLRVAALACAAVCLFWAPAACAIGPHEVALVVNEESLDSILLASVWARLRSVPTPNIVRVRVPKGADGRFPVAVTKERFDEEILYPVRKALEASGADSRVLAWVYSCDFPLRVSVTEGGAAPRPSTNDLSLAGATFLGTAPWPRSEAVVAAMLSSPLYAGPDGPDEPAAGGSFNPGAANPASAFDRVRTDLLDRMPVPSAMLAVTGPGALSVEAAVTVLERAAAADSLCATGVVCFARRDDVRDGSRAWQYAKVVESGFSSEGPLHPQEVPVGSPIPDFPYAGFMTGATSVDPMPRFAPGAYADHFTSYAAAFDLPQQMKATRWLAAGAAFTSGTVCEPYALWTKFPTAWIFPRLASGATMIEAFYASVRSPLQIQPIGDPLCAPWAPKTQVEIELGNEPGDRTGAADGAPLSGFVRLRATLSYDASLSPEPPQFRYAWFVDDRPRSTAELFMWDAAAEEPGAHEVRLVVKRVDVPERPQAFAIRVFETEKPSAGVLW